MEVEFLFAGYGVAVFGGGVEGPLLDGGDDGFVDAVAEAAGHLDVGDLSGGVDDDVEDDVAFGAAGECGEIRVGAGEVAGEGDVDVAGAEGVVRLWWSRASVWRWSLLLGETAFVFCLRGDLGAAMSCSAGWGWLFGLACCGLRGGAAGQVGEHEVGAVVGAGEADGGDPGGAVVDEMATSRRRCAARRQRRTSRLRRGGAMGLPMVICSSGLH